MLCALELLIGVKFAVQFSTHSSQTYVTAVQTSYIAVKSIGVDLFSIHIFMI
jgi:hypothetical protein